MRIRNKIRSTEILALLCAFTCAAFAEDKLDVLYTSPNGDMRIERDGENAWVISTKESTRRAKLSSLESNRSEKTNRFGFISQD